MAAKRKRGKRKKAPTGRLWGPKIGIVGLRVYTGAVFLGVAWWKLFVPGTSIGQTLRDFAELDYIPMIEQAIREPPEVLGWRMDWYADFLASVMLPGNAPYVFGAAILIFEGLLGLALVIGAFVRLMSMLGVLLMLGFGLARSAPFLTVTHGPNWLLMVVLLTLALTAAGRIWGFDARLASRFPRWIS